MKNRRLKDLAIDFDLEFWRWRICLSIIPFRWARPEYKLCFFPEPVPHWVGGPFHVHATESYRWFGISLGTSNNPFHGSERINKKEAGDE